MSWDELLKLFIDAIDVERIRTHAQAIHDRDRWSSYDRYHQTADYLLDLMRHNGLSDRRKITTPADGKTVIGDWLVPLAWDARTGRATVVEPVHRVLADYQSEPNHLVRWSAPTPAEGVTAAVVDVGEGRREDFAKADVRGRIVLTSAWAHEAKALAVEYGALGILTDRMPAGPHPLNEQAVPWHNVFSVHQHWGPAADEPMLWAFTLRPADGRWLRGQLAQAQQPVRVHVQIDARLYAGTIDTVTGRLRGCGSAGEEVWVYTHVYEAGADDNAAGAALAQEVIGTLGRLVAAGRLAPPRRSIRHIAGWEWIGSTIWLHQRRRELRNVVAALCLDGVGLPRTLTEAPVSLCVNPHAQSSYVDGLMLDLWDRYMRLRPPTIIRAVETPFFRGTDTFFSDPVFNIPHVFPYATIGRLWHNSLDRAALHDPEMYRVFAATTGAWLYVVASAGAAEVPELAWTAYARGLGAVAKKLRDPAVCLDAVDYLADIHRRAIRGARRLAPRSASARRAVEAVVGRLNRWVQAEKRALVGRVPERLPARAFAPPAPPRSLTDLGRPRPQRDLMLFPEIIPSRDGRVFGSPFDLVHFPPEQGKRDKPLVSRFLLALYWMDGRRDLAEIDRLVTHETGSPLGPEIVGFLRRLERYGYVRLRWRHPLNRRRIAAAVRRLGVRPGDTIFVHSSLASLGYVEGGPEAVIDGLLEAVGHRGTVAMPTFTFSQKDRRDVYPPYHPRRTASRVGAVTEAFWRRPEARRSASASHSVAAIGPQADFLCQGDVTIEPYSRQSPFGKLYQLDAKVLMIGCGLAPNSSLHAVEDWAGLPSLEPVDHLYEDDAGGVHTITYRRSPVGPRDFYRSSSVVTRSEVLLRQRGVLHDGRLGPAVVYWYRFRELMDQSLAIIRDVDPCFLYRDDPEDPHAPWSQRFREETRRRHQVGQLCYEAGL